MAAIHGGCGQNRSIRGDCRPREFVRGRFVLVLLEILYHNHLKNANWRALDPWIVTSNGSDEVAATNSSSQMLTTMSQVP